MTVFAIFGFLWHHLTIFFTITPHNLALLHSTLRHSYPVPLRKVNVNLFIICLLQAEEAVAELNLGVLDLTSDEFILDEVDIHIQKNLEDDVVKAALESVWLLL